MCKRFTVLLAVLLLIPRLVTAAPADREIISELRGFSGRVGVFAKNLSTGKTIEFNQDEIFPAASTSKLIVALAAYKQLFPLTAPTIQTSYEQDIRLMITVSDNDAFWRFLSEFDSRKRDALSKTAAELRLRKTQIHSETAFRKYNYHSITTPYEMGRVMEMIYNGKYLRKEQTAFLKDQLANTIYNDEIPRYMETPVFHKVGELDDVLCDVGVIQDGHSPILISIYTVTPDHQYASNFMAQTSAKLYNALRRK